MANAVCRTLKMQRRSADEPPLCAGLFLQGWLGDPARLPWTVQSSLEEAGAAFVAGRPWSSGVVVDGLLITGQSSPSTSAWTTAIMGALS